MASRAAHAKKQQAGRTGQNPGIFSLGIGTVVFICIFLYIAVSLIVFLTANHVEYYQVVSGPLAKNQSYTGIAIRSETLVSTDTSGYVTYYVQGDTKIRKSGMLFGIGQTRPEDRTLGMTSQAVQSVHDTILSFAADYDPAKYREVYSLRYDITGKIVSESPILSDDMLSANLNSTSTYTVGDETITSAPKNGVVVYTMDGYEGLTAEEVDASSFDERGYSKTELRTNERVNAGDAVCKIIDSEAWSLVIPLTSLQIVRLDGISDIRVKFLKDGVTQMADLTILTEEDGYYGKLDFDDGMVRYINDRFVDVELVTNTRTGLKIPISSIVSKEFFTVPDSYATVSDEDDSTIGFMKEVRDRDGSTRAEFVSTTLYEHKDGKYYIDASAFQSGDAIVMKNSDGERYIVKNTATLEGVYCTNKGYAIFRKIIILDKNEEYCIVEKGTRYGIAQFDYIVLNSDEVEEDEIIAAKN